MRSGDVWLMIAIVALYAAVAVSLDVLYLYDALGHEIADLLTLAIGVFVIAGAGRAPEFWRNRRRP